jgi:uncharacterized membrane protein
VEKESLSKIGVYLIFVGVFCILLGLIFVTIGKNTYIEANKDGVDALKDEDEGDYIEALNEAIRGQQTGMVGDFFFGFGFIIAFSGIAFCFMSYQKEPLLASEPKPPSPTPIAQPKTQNAEKKYCVNCGKSIPNDAPFCPYCQANQD